MIPSAVDLPAGYVVKSDAPTSYFVKSRTQPGVWWLVRGNDCSCPADVLCWHVRRTYEFERELSTPRPRADDMSDAVVSRFVD